MPTTPAVDYPQEETAEEEGFSPQDGSDTAEGADQFLRDQNQQQEQPQEQKKQGGDSNLDRAKNAKDAVKDAKGLADKFGSGAKAAGQGGQAAGQGAASAGAGAGGSAAGSAGGAAAGTAAGTAAGAGAGAAAGAGGGAAAGASAGAAGGPLAPITVPAGAVLGAVASKLALTKKGKKLILGFLAAGCGCLLMLMLLPVIVIALFFLPGLAKIAETAIPPGPQQPVVGSKILTVTKTASRNQIPLNELNATVVYTITVKNTSSSEATEVKVVDSFISSPDGKLALDVTGYDPNYDVGTLAAGDENVKTFTVNVPHTDVVPGWLLTNKATVTGVVEGAPETASSSTTVAIGESPNCYTFAGSWTETEKAQMLEAINVLITSPTFKTLVCAGNSVELSRVVDGTYYGVTNGAHGITIHGPNTGSLGLRLYILSHESGHVIGNMNPGLLNDFIASGIFEAEGLMPTYAKELGLPSTNCSAAQVNIPYACYDESFAEMTSDYVIYTFYSFPSRAWSGYPGGVWFHHGSASWDSFDTDRPQHYNFARSRVFGGSAF